MNVTLLVNPAARAGAHTGAAPQAAERCAPTASAPRSSAAAAPPSPRDLLRTALRLGTDAVVVAGGDGTVHLAIQEVAGTGIPLGIIPAGTGNDFAAHARPAGAGCRRGGRRRSRPAAPRVIDLARVTRVDGTTTYFGSVLASGFDSKVNDRANAMRWPRGGSRYNIAILVEFLTLAGIPYEVELELADGTRERVAGDLVMATVGNGRTYGGGIPICPDADPADGLLDVVLVRPAGRLRLLRLLPRVYQGTHAAVAEVSMRLARSVRLVVARRDRLRGRRPDRGAPADDRRRPAVRSRSSRRAR